MMKSFLLSGIVAATMGLTPGIALAATPQHSLNAALKSVAEYTPLRVVGDTHIVVQEHPFTKRTPTETIKLHFTFSERMHSREKGSEQVEGRLALDRIEAQGEGAGPIPFELDKPIAVQWKQLGTTFYGRIEQVPQSLIDLLASAEIDAHTAIGQWIHLDTAEFFAHVKARLPLELMPTSTTSSMNSFVMKDLKQLSQYPMLQVLRVERREKQPDGQSIVRLRARINPATIQLLQTMEKRNLPRDPAERRAQLQAIDKKYAEIRKLLNGMQMAIMVDETARTLKRIEIGGTQVKTDQTCAWNTRLKRSICRNTGRTTITYAIGMTFQKDTGGAIERPTNSMSVMDLFQQLNPSHNIESSQAKEPEENK